MSTYSISGGGADDLVVEVPDDGVPPTAEEVEVVESARAEGYSYSVEQLRSNRREALSSLAALMERRSRLAGSEGEP
ncbi:hypothetical protein [Actinomyces succiniciruminis]|uniref:Uncharacterized protein n=1 Tax=Actinomyces succiniciruminis TaxID=1522002 RepID=A0A1L7RB49_9ACTO|nr:hypothetical protein [Actinomyces succiniciruminis]CED91087.1 Hypothetical protein AAM4_1255 [Actinomyces succiniciruminis]